MALCGFGLRAFGRLGWGGVCLGCVGVGCGVRASCWLTNLRSGGVRPSALPGVAFVPYGAVPDGGRRGFEAAVAVRAPIV